MIAPGFDGLKVALADRYRIERELGEGGMATVYLAHDERHDRRVAVKVLKPELAAALGADRFLAEIKTTANLQHPHILPLFDSGEANGFLFYVMPYVDGETLYDRLARDGHLPLEETLRIASDVAEAIQAAHEQGVIHRDIKPANILMSRGRALVADFGIARAARASNSARLTQTGSALGTAGYMSPEQAAGSSSVDHRADIYSLACMVYEMLAGEPPYPGPTLLAILMRQATEPVPSVRRLQPTVPPGLEKTISIAMAREPGDRFESAAAFAQAMLTHDAVSVSAQTPQEKTVVVLPFANRSGNAENEYFSDGLTEEVISDLARLSSLRVISRNSAMALKGTTKDTSTLARELGVSHLVTGSVRRAGQALRVTAELVEAKTDTPIWSEKYSGTVEDVFGIQEHISSEIVTALQVTLADSGELQTAERPIADVVAYDCYLRARQEMYIWTRDAQRLALRLVDQALEIVGDSPLLLATAGQIHWSQVNTNLVPAEEGLPRASELVSRALSIDPDCHLAIFVRGLVAGLRGQPEVALKDLYRANELRPGDANVLAELCRYSNVSGLPSHWKFVEQLSRIDPLTPLTPLVVSSYRWMNGPREEAAPPARRAIELAPQASMLHVIAGWQIAEAGFREEAIEILGRAGAEIVDSVDGAIARFLRCALEGNEEEALRHTSHEMEKTVGNEFARRIMADGHALLGRRDDSLRWLRSAIEAGFIHHPCLARGDVFLEALHGNPEFEKMMTDLEPRWQAVVEWEASLP
ncbi:MAG: protein kinase [Gemmatimonadota bacterium]